MQKGRNLAESASVTELKRQRQIWGVESLGYLVAQMVKSLYYVFYITCIMRKDHIIHGTLGKIVRNWFPLQCEKLVYTKEVLLPGKSHGWRSLVACRSWGPYSQTRLSDFTFTFYIHALEKAMATHSSILAWRIPGTGSLVGCRLWGRTEWDTTKAMKQQQQQQRSARFTQTNIKDLK